ncbi:MAG TPA: fibronectin type III domain-containing protein [Pyrinomonadaceae bacterium]|jgi:hypothetical protein
MAKFPQDETSTIRLAELVANGMKSNGATFPNPAVDPALMLTDLAAYRAKLSDIQASEAATRLKVQEKNEIYGRIREAARDNVDYAEIVAKGDAAILELINWGNRADAQRLQSPGQTRVLEIIGQGDGWVRLDWKEPIDGGDIASYKIQRSEDGAKFSDVGTAIGSEAALFEQPTGKKLFYRVAAINRAGEGLPSNTVSLSL